jgi:hypothetical protein
MKSQIALFTFFLALFTFIEVGQVLAEQNNQQQAEAEEEKTFSAVRRSRRNVFQYFFNWLN